jgi:hypothetical protein
VAIKTKEWGGITHGSKQNKRWRNLTKADGGETSKIMESKKIHKGQQRRLRKSNQVTDGKGYHTEMGETESQAATDRFLYFLLNHRFSHDP